jgi:pimeloyl-ACP methyl ester carboxylesterase
VFFASLGYAVLVWDKRGIGDTPGEYQEGRALAESARDVIAGVEYLRGRSEIDARKIGVYGVSQGGWIGPLAATMSPHIAFVIANSGPGVMVAESNIAQRANEWIEDGYTDADTAEIKPFLRETWRYYGTGEGYERAAAARAAVRHLSWFKKLGFADSTPAPAALAAPRYDYYRRGRYDPDSVLRKVRVPILGVFGEKDRHIPMPESARRFEASLKDARHAAYTVRVFKDAGHGISRIPPGQIERLRGPRDAHGSHEYAPEFRPFLASWLAASVSGM